MTLGNRFVRKPAWNFGLGKQGEKDEADEHTYDVGDDSCRVGKKGYGLTDPVG